VLARLRTRMSFANVAAVLALVLALSTSGAAQPVANSAATLGKKVRNALRIGKKADRRARKALRQIKKGVPQATNATHAVQADTATTLDALRVTGSEPASSPAIKRINLNAGEERAALTTDNYSLTIVCQKVSGGRVSVAVRLDPIPDVKLTIPSTEPKAVGSETPKSNRMISGPTEPSTNPRGTGGTFTIYESFGTKVSTGVLFADANPLGTNVDCTGGGYVFPAG
jgi:hypothetical protein